MTYGASAGCPAISQRPAQADDHPLGVGGRGEVVVRDPRLRRRLAGRERHACRGCRGSSRHTVSVTPCSRPVLQALRGEERRHRVPLQVGSLEAVATEEAARLGDVRGHRARPALHELREVRLGVQRRGEQRHRLVVAVEHSDDGMVGQVGSPRAGSGPARSPPHEVLGVADAREHRAVGRVVGARRRGAPRARRAPRRARRSARPRRPTARAPSKRTRCAMASGAHRRGSAGRRPGPGTPPRWSTSAVACVVWNQPDAVLRGLR